MTPPPRASSWRGVEKRKVVIISWCCDFNRRVCRGDGGWPSLYLVFLFFFFFELYDYCLRYKILHAARAMA